MENQTWLARLLFIGMPIALAIEFFYGILSTERFIPVYPFIWMPLRHFVLFGAGCVCIVVLVRWGQHTHLVTHWYAILAAILSLVSFLVPYFWGVLPDLFWSVLCFCSAFVSYILLYSVEKPLQQNKPAVVKSPGRKQVSIVEAVPTFLLQKTQKVSFHWPTILIFYYSDDVSWADKCNVQLRVFEAQDRIALWDEHALSHRQRELEQALVGANVAILLVSARFLSECAPQLALPLRGQEQRPDFSIYPVIVGMCAYGKGQLCEYYPYWSSANLVREPLHQLPLHKQTESFCSLATLIAEKLYPSEVRAEESPSEEHVPTCIEPSSEVHVVTGITEADKVSLLQVRVILQKEGLSNHTFSPQYTNGEYLRWLQEVVVYPNPPQEQVALAREAMRIIIKDDKKMSSQTPVL